MLRCSCSRGSIRPKARSCFRSFLEIFWIIHILNLPPLRGSKSSSLVQCLNPHLEVIVPVNPNQLISQAGLGLLHSKVIELLPCSIRGHLSRLSRLLRLFRLCLQVHHLLFGCGQHYLRVMELLMLLLSLRLSVLEANLSTLPPPLLSSQFCSKLLIFLLSGTQSLASLCAKVINEPSLVPASFTHSSAINTSWMTYTKMTKECSIK